MKKSNIINKILSIIFIIDAILLIVSSSIVVPCLDRNFYFIQIDSLDIVDETDPLYTEEHIKEAYNELLDFIWKDTDFSVGNFKYSEEGMNHFIDCKVLFKLDFNIFIISLSVFIVLILLSVFKIIKFYRFFNISPIFYSAVIVLILGVLILMLALPDFDKAFEVFHLIFFPGKDNWMFNPNKDEIIWILTEDYFMNCAILIVSILLTECIASIIYGIINRNYIINKNKKMKLD